MGTLTELQTSVIDQAYEFYEAIADVMNYEENNNAVAKITHYFNNIITTATTAQLTGLPTICEQAKQLIAQLPTLDAPDKYTICQEIEKWPRLIYKYLYSPTDLALCHQITTSLQQQSPQIVTTEILEKLSNQLAADCQLFQAIDITEMQANDDNHHHLQENQPPENGPPENEPNEKHASGKKTDPALWQAKTDLINQLVEKSDILAQALNHIVTQDEESEAFLNGIEQYTNTVQEFWEQSEFMELTGFQQVCTFINDNIFEVSSLPEVERFKCRELFAQWPHLALEYLQTPDTGAAALVEQLIQPQWPQPMSTKTATELVNRLLVESKLLSERNNSIKLEKQSAQSFDNTENHVTVMPNIEQTNDSENSELVSEELEQTKIIEAIEDEKLIIDLTDKIIEHKKNIHEVIETKTEQINDLDFNELESLAVDKFEAFEEKIDKNRVQESTDEQVISVDSDVSTTSAMTSNQSEPLQFHPQLEPKPPKEKVHSSPPTKSISLVSSETLDHIVAEITEAQNDLSTALGKFISAEDESPKLLEAVEQYNDNVQSIAETAQRVQLEGLQEICLFITDNVFELSTHPHAIRRAAKPYLEAWPRLVLTYLQNPLPGAQNLISHLQLEAWPYPLDQIQSHQLLTILTQGAIDTPVNQKIDPSSTPHSITQAVTEEILAPQIDSKNTEITGVLSIEETTHVEEIEKATIDADQTNHLATSPLHKEMFSEKREEIEEIIEETEETQKNEIIKESEVIKEAVETSAEVSTIEAVDASEVEIIEAPIRVTEPTQTQIVLAAPEVIELLIGQITEVSTEVQPILSELVNAEEGSETLLTSAESYTEQVQAIWEAAEMAQLAALQEVCTHINDNVMLFATQDASTRMGNQEIFALWPEKVVAYLQNPAVETETLIKTLQHEHWPNPLDDDTASQLRVQLTQPSHSSAIEQNEPPELTEEANIAEPVQVQEIVLAEPDVLALIIGQIIDTQEELANALEKLVTNEAGSEELLLAVESYTEQVQAVWEAGEMAGLVGLQDVCTFINENVMMLSGQVQSARVAGRDVLAQWPDQVIAYLQQPAQETSTLIILLQNDVWPAPLTVEAAENLQQHLTASQAEPLTLTLTLTSASSANEEEIVLAAPDILEIVSQQITDLTEGMSSALEVCVSMENDNPALLEAIEDYTNQVQAIWETAEMAGLKGLQEVCTFINDNLMVFSTQEKEQKLATQTYLLQWPGKVLEYLQSPTNGANNLVSFMQETGWPSPLDSEAATRLLTLLTTPVAGEVAETSQENVASSSVSSTNTADAGVEMVALPPLEVEISGEISLGTPDVLEILQGEMEMVKEDLNAALEKYTTLPKTDASLADVAENYTDQVSRINSAAEIMGLEGLQAVCAFINDNVTFLSTQETTARVQAKPLLISWPDRLQAYFQSPAENILVIVDLCRQPAWGHPLSDDAAKAMVAQLAAGSTAEAEEESAEEAYSRPKVANPEDVLLNIPEDINRDLLEAYLQETPQHATDFSAAIQNIIQGADTSEIERAQRIAHTLKGSSNIIGIKGIANIAHHLEDTLEYLAKHKVTPPKELTDTMVEAADCLEMMVDALVGREEAPEQAQQVLQTVLDWANRIDKGKLDAPPAPTAPAPAATESATPAAGATAQPKTENKPKAGAAPEVTAENVLRVPTRTIDELMRLVGELSISVGQIQDKLKHVLQSTRLLTEQDLVLQQKTFALENLVDVRGITGIDSNSHKTTTMQEEDFDPLEFEEYNELHSVAHSFIESIADNRELALSIREELAELETMFIHQERINKEFQASIMTTRMVPVSTMLSKLQRNVRQTCRATGKKAELEISGTDILIDSDVLTNLADPLQHILRNAIDHGLESPDDRAILGKSESGTINLSFYREGNNIVVKCQDDGQGLNYANIRFTAIQRGLITENQEMTEPELARLILMSGFSTKSGVTQVSGRGVGMDVVHTNIRQMKGTLDLFSETGKGTTILIKLPMTLVTVHVLLIRVGELRFGIPTNHLEQALAPGIGEYQKVGEQITLKIGKNLYAVKYLGNMLNISGDKEFVDENDTRPIILAREETGITSVVVDELIDTHDLVMKNMGHYVKKIRGVAGAAILGDGNLVPLLDLPELLRVPMQSIMSSYVPEQGEESAMGAPGVPHILVVDDSLSVRKSLSLLLEEAGFDTLLAKDGLEAIEVMNQTRPNVMLVDMEMPRMNGLELTAHVRANQATQNLPIFMITSRTTEKHREQAKSAGVSAYLTKPYQDTELLDLIDKALAGKIS